MPTYADLEIRILECQDAGYPVEITLNADLQYPRGFLSPELPTGDGAALFAWLFANTALREAWEHARGQHPQRRIRLRIDATAPELHALPWESLRDPATGLDLAATDATPFSRYLAGTWHPGAPLLTRPLKLLVAIAAPENLADYGLAPLDAEAEWAALCEATADPDVTLTRLPVPCTLAALEAELRRGYHALHLIAHGTYSQRQGKAALYLADAANQVAVVSDDDFAAMLKRQLADSDPDGAERLRLVFLASCESAKHDTADAFRGLAPRLVVAGVPAIVAMQDYVSLTAAREFSRVFYRQLTTHGRVDLAGNQARAALLTGQALDAGVPVLLMRLKDGRLWKTSPAPTPESTPAPGTVYNFHVQNATGFAIGDGAQVVQSAPATAPPATSAGSPTSPAALRPRLQRLNDVQIETLCMDCFPTVYDQFSRGLRRDEKINLLLNYVRHRPAEAVRLMNILEA